MTRQEKRRKARQKNTTYNLNADQLVTIQAECYKQALNEIQEDLDKQLKEESASTILEAFTELFYLPLLVLRNQGWGKTRLTRFANELAEQVGMYEEKYFSAIDVKQMLIDETGVDINFNIDQIGEKSSITVESV